MRQAIHTRLYFVLLLFIVVTLPFTKNINSYCIALLALNWFVEGRFKEKWQRLRHDRLLWLFLTFFVLHLLSVLYSSHWQDALKLVERKLSLLVFPIILCSITLKNRLPNAVDSGDVKAQKPQQILLAFVASVLLGAFFCLAFHFWKWIASGTVPDFFYHSLTKPIGVSAIYYSCYVCFSIFILAFYFKEKLQRLNNGSKSIIAIAILFLTGFLVLLSSKLFLIVFIFFGNGFLFFFIFKRQRIKWAIVSIFLFAGVIFLAAFIIPATKTRFLNIYNSNFTVIQQEQFQYDTPFSGLTLRLVLWQIAVKVISHEQAWVAGVGIGDAEPLLNDQYRERNLYLGNPSLNETGYLNYNVHNQYLQVLLEIGAIGLMLWLAYLMLPFIVAWQRGNGLWQFFIMIMAVFAITEVYLATHKGIVFFALFQSLFAFQWKEKEKTEPRQMLI